MLFKVTNKDNRGNAIFIQGAYSKGTSNDIAAMTFQNYDEDTKKVYNIAGLSARDAFGTSDSNGEGELLFWTNTDGSNMTEKMRLKSTGQFCIGNSNAATEFALLSVYGNTVVTSNLYVSNNTDLNGYLVVASNITLCNNLSVLNDTQLRGGLILSSNATFCNTLNALANVIVSSNLFCSNNTVLLGNLSTYSNVTFCNSLYVGRTTEINGQLTVTSNATFSNDITTFGSLAVSSNVVVGGDQLNIGNITTFKSITANSNMTASNDLFICRNSTFGVGSINAQMSITGSTSIQTNQSNACLRVNQTGTGNVLELSGLNTRHVTLSNNGFLGVGTSNATRRLDVNGDINFEGMIYQNNVAFPREPLIQTFTKANTNSKEYQVLLSWVNDLSFSNIRNVKSIQTKSYVLPGPRDTSSNVSYSLRVYDFTNNRVLAEQAFSNQDPRLVQLTLSNLNTNTLTELELQGKVGAVGSNLCVENLLYKFN